MAAVRAAAEPSPGRSCGSTAPDDGDDSRLAVAGLARESPGGAGGRGGGGERVA
jgi:hypothetical protein